MKVVILEDEKSAAKNLTHMLSEIEPSIHVDCVIDTVSNAVEYLKKENDIVLAFFDIHLADGNSFDIFKEVKVNVPVIFTTAYDEYAIKAFKINSIDYLLKPIDEDELGEAIKKFKSSNKNIRIPQEFESIFELLQTISKKYKSTFLVQQRDKLIPLEVGDIAYITIIAGVVRAITFEDKSYVINEKLEDIETLLNPDFFFRANRQFIIQRKSIQSLTLYFNGKLILNIKPNPLEKIIISKAKATQFKNWIDSHI